MENRKGWFKWRTNLTFAMSRFRLDSDVTVCAVDDAACLKTPIVVCHVLDRRFVLAGEGHICQISTCVECSIPDARYARRDRHWRQTTATGERTLSDARHARRDRYTCKIVATIKRSIPDARRICSDFNYLKFFYPSIRIFVIQPGAGHSWLIYLSRPVVFLRIPICKCYFRLGVSSWFCCYRDASTNKIFYSNHHFFPLF